MRIRMGAVVAVVCVLVTVLVAQSGRARLSGIIADASGAALPGVTVTLTATGTSISAVRRTVSNARGEFAFENVTPARYEIRAELPGFALLTQKVSVTAGATPPRLTLRMTVGPAAESVAVTSARARCPPTSASPPRSPSSGCCSRSPITWAARTSTP